MEAVSTGSGATAWDWTSDMGPRVQVTAFWVEDFWSRKASLGLELGHEEFRVGSGSVVFVYMWNYDFIFL